MTEIERKIERDERGFISTITDVGGDRLVHVQRDAEGRLQGVREYRDAASPSAPEVLERVEHVEQGLASTKRQTSEVAQLLDLRSERLKRRLDIATTPPAPASWEEFHDRMARMTTRLGGRRDGSGLHLAVAGAAVAASTGDMVRAVELLRGAEEQP